MATRLLRDHSNCHVEQKSVRHNCTIAFNLHPFNLLILESQSALAHRDNVSLASIVGIRLLSSPNVQMPVGVRRRAQAQRLPRLFAHQLRLNL